MLRANRGETTDLPVERLSPPKALPRVPNQIVLGSESWATCTIKEITLPNSVIGMNLLPFRHRNYAVTLHTSRAPSMVTNRALTEALSGMVTCKFQLPLGLVQTIHSTNKRGDPRILTTKRIVVWRGGQGNNPAGIH